jgi:hypothetical protein
MSRLEDSHSKKSYKEALLTPSATPETSPNNSTPNSPDKNIFIRNHSNINISLGIIDRRLKWFINKNNKESICGQCKKGIIQDEWNSYYTVYAERYINILDRTNIKVYNDLDKCDNEIFCNNCKKVKMNEYKLIGYKMREALNRICLLNDLNLNMY